MAIYMWREATPITTAWIYHSPSLWLISLSSDWTNWITIADKNLGATTVWNSGDTLSEANCWKYFQWWNNYWFPFTWAVTTSSTQVDASTYWPWNYYSSSTFIIWTWGWYWANWDNPENNNLWWWVDWTVYAMQWPCPTWYHIPSNNDFQNIMNIWNSLNLWDTTILEGPNNISKYLKMPFAWRLAPSDWIHYVTWTQWAYWSSQYYDTSSASWLSFSNKIYYPDSFAKSYWLSIRPFKNEVVAPDNTWTKLYEKATPLCFTANTAGSTVKLNKIGSPTSVTLETSSDGISWSTYTMGSTKTLSNIGDTIYFRNQSESITGFSISTDSYYQFVMTWSISASWDINYLLCKNSTIANGWRYCYVALFYNCTSLTTPPSLPGRISSHYYDNMFYWCTSLITVPELPATALGTYCYQNMFAWCTSLITLPSLPATALADYCYKWMFSWCSKIKISTSQTGDYQTAYRVPTTWSGTTAGSALNDMFRNTWWTFKGTPTINTTYYTSNQVI